MFLSLRMARVLGSMAVVAGVATMGCAGSSAGTGDGPSGASSGDTAGAAALFGAPSGAATPGVLLGLWGGVAEANGVTFDSRMRLAGAQITLAARCRLPDGRMSGVVSVAAAARVSADAITVLESKSVDKDDGVVRCAIHASPFELRRCSSDTFELKRMCFVLEGSTLTQYFENPLEKIEYTKLSD
jgi:hypothetical protein